MNVSLSPRMRRFLERKVSSGGYDSTDQVIEAALAHLEQHEKAGEFAPGELDELCAVGEADIERGAVYDGEETFRELEELSAKRRKEQGK
jgi:putative addiction module CopG family antidote